MGAHLLSDVAAAFLAGTLTLWAYRRLFTPRMGAIVDGDRGAYFLWLAAGAILGAYTLGTLNLWLSGLPGVGRSILGSLTGGIIAVELYKARHGITGSTGGLFVLSFCTAVAVGRIGCHLAGLPDMTYGIPTGLPWGVDHGDGIPRHPVALYESAVMALVLLWAVVSVLRASPFFVDHGFHVMVAIYAGQRFLWEFLKPYGPVAGPLNIFHLTCLGLLAYAAFMLSQRPAHVRT